MKPQISFFQRLPSNSFKSVSRVSQYTRETERPKKTSKPRDRARKEATKTSGDIFVVEEERREFKRVLRCFSA